MVNRTATVIILSMLLLFALSGILIIRPTQPISYHFDLPGNMVIGGQVDYDSQCGIPVYPDPEVDCKHQQYFITINRQDNTLQSAYLDLPSSIRFGDLLSAWGQPDGVDSYTGLFRVVYWGTLGVVVYTPNGTIEPTSRVDGVLWTNHKHTTLKFEGLYR